jgi:hypothetical protein
MDRADPATRGLTLMAAMDELERLSIVDTKQEAEAMYCWSASQYRSMISGVDLFGGVECTTPGPCTMCPAEGSSEELAASLTTHYLDNGWAFRNRCGCHWNRYSIHCCVDCFEYIQFGRPFGREFPKDQLALVARDSRNFRTLTLTHTSKLEMVGSCSTWDKI